MLNVKLNTLPAMQKNSNPFKEEKSTLTPNATVNTSYTPFTASNIQANFAPFISFKGIHERAVVGVETKIRGISQEDFQKSATSLQWRHKQRKARGETDKVNLRMEFEEDKNSKIAIAIYHDYKNKSYKLGFLPDYLTKEVVPLMNKNLDFHASVVDVAGGSLDGFTNVGVKVRLEYLSKPERSPNTKKIKLVKKAFENAMKAAKVEAEAKNYTVPAVMNLREEIMVSSKNFDGARLKIDTEKLQNSDKKEIPIYKKGWKQLDVEISDDAIVRNRRKHSQNNDFVENAKQAAEHIKKKLKIKKEK